MSELLSSVKAYNPWATYALADTNQSMTTALRWAEFLWYKNLTYRQAFKRVLGYFITKPVFEGISETERCNYEHFFSKVMKLKAIMSTIGEDYLCYGNSFTSVSIPFVRFLVCPTCSSQWPVTAFKTEFKDYKFHGNCPKCRKHVVFKRVDTRSRDASKISVIRWSPHDIVLQFNFVTNTTKYFWKCPEYVKKEIRFGNPLWVATTPWEIIEAVRAGKLFEFSDKAIFHMKNDILAGIPNKGWGIPDSLISYPQLFYVQMLKKQNEAIGMDYIVPLRIITPAPRAGGPEGDPLYSQNLGDFRSNFSKMIDEHRMDPASFHFMPFPVQYQTTSGEGKNMAPVELMNAGQDELLNGSGVPAEFYRGTLDIKALPTALRLFEQTWFHLVSLSDAWLTWFTEQVSWAMRWEKPESVGMEPVMIADDIERRNVLIQLAGSGRNIPSWRTALAPLHIDPIKEIEKSFVEQEIMLRKQREFNEKQQAADAVSQAGIGGLSAIQAQKQQQGIAAQGMQPQGGPAQGSQGAPPVGQGGPPLGGAPGPSVLPAGGMGGGGPSSSVEELLAQADQMAQQLMGMDETSRKSQLIQLKRTNPTLHAYVKAKMDDIRQQVQTQGYIAQKAQMGMK